MRILIREALRQKSFFPSDAPSIPSLWSVVCIWIPRITTVWWLRPFLHPRISSSDEEGLTRARLLISSTSSNARATDMCWRRKTEANFQSSHSMHGRAWEWRCSGSQKGTTFDHREWAGSQMSPATQHAFDAHLFTPLPLYMVCTLYQAFSFPLGWGQSHKWWQGGLPSAADGLMGERHNNEMARTKKKWGITAQGIELSI